LICLTFFQKDDGHTLQFGKFPGSTGKTGKGAELAVGGVEASEGVGAGAEFRLAEAVERRLDGVEEFVHVATIGLDKEEAGDDLARRVPLLKVGQ
jgi:hypothetical protein